MTELIHNDTVKPKIIHTSVCLRFTYMSLLNGSHFNIVEWTGQRSHLTLNKNLQRELKIRATARRRADLKASQLITNDKF